MHANEQLKVLSNKSSIKMEKTKDKARKKKEENKNGPCHQKGKNVIFPMI
jgi:hypothetical protein